MHLSFVQAVILRLAVQRRYDAQNLMEELKKFLAREDEAEE